MTNIFAQNNYQMKYLSVFIFILTPLFLNAQANDAEDVAIRQTLMNYINGRNNGNVEQLRSAFHPTADLRYVKGDADYRIWPIDDYIGGVKPGQKADCVARIISVDRLGNAAQAKIEIEYPQLKFADYINLLKVDGEWKIAIKTFSRQRIDPAKKVLFVLTSQETMGDSEEKTGLHLGEVTHAYWPLKDAGYEIYFTSPKGGKTRMYGMNLNDPVNLRFVQDPTAYYHFTHAIPADQIMAEEYAAIYFVGGHGTMWDLPNNEHLAKATASIYEAGGVVGAVCHGVAGLLNVQLEDGNYLIKDKALTSFTDEEEKAAKADDMVPFLLETALREKGAQFSGAPKWQAKVVTDGRLVTGQNPASVDGLAAEMLRLLSKDKK